MDSMRSRWFLVALLSLGCAVLGSAPGWAQEDGPVRRGRKYKSPPETAHIEVLVTKKTNGKPIMNAAVVFHSKKDGRDEGNMEVKTDPEGKASIDVIPTGSDLTVQVIANGFATYAGEYVVDAPTKQIAVAMLRPQAQVSAYEDNSGKASDRKAGVQEPVKPQGKAPSAKPDAGSVRKSAPAPASEQNRPAPVPPQI